MNTATLKRIRNAKDANERDRLHFVGHVEDGMGITEAAALPNKSRPWGSKWWKRYKSEWFYGERSSQKRQAALGGQRNAGPDTRGDLQDRGMDVRTVT